MPGPERSGPVYPTIPAAEGFSPPVGEQPGGDGHDVGAPVAPAPPVQAAPVAAAFATAWARPDLTAQAWWQGVAALCDDGFAAALRTVDPAQVPATRVTGQPVVVEAPEAGAAVYDVPTDAGTLTVTLSDVGGRWVVTGNDFSRAVR
ncbi:hypothetical protein [Micromonospora sp. LOL_023]|uniref:hypothetical protein n=1 Tax=Micromonospora sp. LOL_023 TaxID=3345418 RepID=UPI003A86FBE7